MKNNTSQKTLNKKPAPFIAPGAERYASKEEIERRLIRIERAKEIGEDFTGIISDESEIENPYRVKALLYIMEDKEVPEDLKEQIKKFDLKYGITRNV